MQKKLRIGFLLVLLLLVVETARLAITVLDHVEIQVVAVKQPPLVEVLEDALGVTPTGPPASTGKAVSTSLPYGGISIQKAVLATTSPTRLASTPTYRPSPDPTASPTPTATLLPYRTVVPERKPDRQATAPATQAGPATPAESSPVQPTNSPPEGNPASPTKQPPSTPTSAPGALPTSAPVEPPTPESPPLPTSVP